MLLYVHRDHKDCQGQGAQDGHLHFHTAPELCISKFQAFECVGERGGSMNEESQVRGCYNITFICTNQEPV